MPTRPGIQVSLSQIFRESQPPSHTPGHDVDLPAGFKLAQAVRWAFERQESETIAKIHGRRKAIKSGPWMDVEYWLPQDFTESEKASIRDAWQTYVSIGYATEADQPATRKRRRRAAADPLKESDRPAPRSRRRPRSMPPYVEEGVDHWCGKLSRTANQITEQRLQAVVLGIKAELKAGILAGDATTELSKRVQSVFREASKNRSQTIALSESARAFHFGQFTHAEVEEKETGLRIGKSWLASADACPKCLAMAAKGAIALRKAFDEGPDPDYGLTLYPPLHPRCRCSMATEIHRGKG